MTECEQFILDTNVISSFYSVGWLSSLDFWTPDTNLIAPERVWGEFEAYANATCPEWLETRNVDLDRARVAAPGALAPADWACIVLAESVETGCLVTNDRAMHDIAAERSVNYLWGTQFLLKTFHGCGISKIDLEAKFEPYADDLGLTEDIRSDVLSREK